MADAEGGAARRPQLFLDHVLVPAVELEETAARFERDYGLLALPGGRHPDVGTANMIIPLGRTYIELIAVVDASEAEAFPRSRRVQEAAARGLPFATWAARCDDLDAFRAALLASGWDLPPPAPGARRRPDGVLLEWRTQELARDPAPSVLPFVIEWRVPAGAHPAAAPASHRSGAGDIVAARFTAPDPAAASAQLRDLVGDGFELTVDAGDRPALVAVELESPGGRIRVP